MATRGAGGTAGGGRGEEKKKGRSTAEQDDPNESKSRGRSCSDCAIRRTGRMGRILIAPTSSAKEPRVGIPRPTSEEGPCRA